ncbi:unnamed protein product [Schistocephalus solidus]|uniref:C2H2-type domain-containing protein n=1 Tax=Schistocephalus solidus TaxID=70667 RepID=A0A3P7DJ70_SCHSO|nr:unnamed protein product [Schistocephalus solidus]
MRLHMLYMHERAFVDKDFICTYCNKPFETHDKMQEHIATDHQTKKLFECAYCDLKFSKACDRKQHIYDVHPDKPKFVCNVCSKRLITQKEFCKHRREHSDAPVQTYNCDHCTDSFTDPFHLLCHLRATHTELEIHACEYCSQLFNTDAEVQEHTKEAHAGKFRPPGGNFHVQEMRPSSEESVVPSSSRQDEAST